MTQFRTILGFELKTYMKNKAFVGVTVFMVLLIAAVMFFPRLSGLVKEDSPAGDPSAAASEGVMLLAAKEGSPDETLQAALAAALPGYTLRTEDAAAVRDKVAAGEAACGVVLTGPIAYQYYAGTISLFDDTTAVIDEVLQENYRLTAMVEGGMSADRAGEILSAAVTHTEESTGKDQRNNFFYTYIMIFALYMVIILYGQMVATNVATEKSSRAMELLITSARPTAMMFGKVIASCLAGFAQILCIFGSAVLFFQLNKEYWQGNLIIESIFNMPPELLGYMLLFFVLGFFIYAFMYGAVGSTASKLEDINTSIMPISMLFVVGFCVVMFSMSGGDVDSPLMVACSFIPFTSPMAMFTRIAMSTVPVHEIVISIVILIGSVFGVGVLAARIYRVGVLLYGTPPKIGAILKMAVKKQ